MAPKRRREPKHDPIFKRASSDFTREDAPEQIGRNKIKVPRLDFHRIREGKPQERISRNIDNVIWIRKRAAGGRRLILEGGEYEKNDEYENRKEKEAMRVQIKTSIDRLFGRKPSAPACRSNKQCRKQHASKSAGSKESRRNKHKDIGR